MSEQTELEWLVAERPQPLPLDEITTARVRAELMRRADAGHARSSAPNRRARPRVRARGLRDRALRIAVGGVTLAGAASVALLATGGGGGAAHGHAGGGGGLSLGPLAVQNASARQLTHLSAKLVAAPPPVGDATLVLRRQVYPNSPEIDGADLYADNGDYYYSPSLSGLPAVISSGQTVDGASQDQEVRDIAAAKAALTGPIDSARHQMSVANLDPAVMAHSTWKSVYGPISGQRLAKMPAAFRQKVEEVQAKAKADAIHSVIGQENGMIWDNGMDALLAGAGDPNVRAGVLDLFATIPQITVTPGTLNGQQTLDLTASVLSSNTGLYQEELILDASTGIPLEMIGGNKGQAPGVTVHYTITRTTVAAVRNGSAG